MLYSFSILRLIFWTLHGRSWKPFSQNGIQSLTKYIFDISIYVYVYDHTYICMRIH